MKPEKMQDRTDYLKLLQQIPVDPRTIRKKLKLDPHKTTYGVCPKCYFIYDPDSMPRKCQNVVFGKTCNDTVAKPAVMDGQSVLRPIRPFAVNSYDDFIERLLSRPGMEKLLRDGCSNVEKETKGSFSELRDIK